MRLFATHLYSKDNKQRRKSGAVKHLSQLKRAAFYPRAITITSGGRTIRHTVSADGGCRCFFLPYCPLNVLNVLFYSFLHSLQLLYHERNVLHMHGETCGAMNSLPLALTLCCITWPRGPMLPLFNAHTEALMWFNRISTLGLCTQMCFYLFFFIFFLFFWNFLLRKTHTK